MTTVERAVHFRADDGHTDAVLRYDSDRPFEVRFDFTGDNVWRCGRRLLADGLQQLSGTGDVACWRDGWSFFVSMSSPDGRAVLACTAAVVEAFLADTYRLVADGAERLDFDADLDLLLMNGAR